MKVSYEWLQSYFDEKLPSPDEIARVLTFHAFEIEGVETIGSDTVIAVDVLPNRSSDCLSHRGIARELATLLSLSLVDDPLKREVHAVPDSNVLEVVVDNPELCLRFSAVVVNNVSVGPSPEWLRKRLEAIGQKSINNIVDATNYVMFDLGQPLHAFDRDKLAEHDGGVAITVRVGKKNERITILSGEEYEVGENNLLITDGNSGAPLGIAGVKGGARAAIDENTTNLIIEAAHFNYVSVRKTSQALKLMTDASIRFQNEPSPELTRYALAEVVTLLGGEIEGFVDQYPEPTALKPVSVSVREVNRFLGTDISHVRIENIIKRFNFIYKTDGDVFTVVPPFERTDLSIKEDIIEEVGRVYGYEHIVSSVLPPRSRMPAINKKFYYAEKIRRFLTDLGFSEVYTHALVGSGDVELVNALSADCLFLRNTLTNTLQESLKRNNHNTELLGLPYIGIFEIGTVFTTDGEHTSLGIASSDSGENSAENICAKLLINLGTNIKGICVDGVCEVSLSTVLEGLPNPESYDQFLITNVIQGTKFIPISPYPFVLRDIALWVPESVSGEDVLVTIKKEAGELLHTLRQFDEYKKDGRVSYAFRLVFQSYEKTLTDEEVGEVMKKIETTLHDRGFEVR